MRRLSLRVVDAVRCRRLSTEGAGGLWAKHKRDAHSNVPARVANEWYGRQLLHLEGHPLCLVRQRIEGYFRQLSEEAESELQQQVGATQRQKRVKRRRGRALFPTVYHVESAVDPVVSVRDNFDVLMVPAEHPGRSPHDTYYVNAEHVLRTHTTAHNVQLFSQGHRAWIISGDVYRRDTVDATHFPVFHQMDGGRVFHVDELGAGVSAESGEAQQYMKAEQDMKGVLEGLALDLFGEDCETRWIEEYFPFTEPSWELEVLFHGEWLEVLGSGLMRAPILQHAGYDGSQHLAWAFGMGLDRLAMILYDITDIRTFWSTDERFLRQFRGKGGERVKFQAFSKYPPSPRDISFWIPDAYHENEFHELVREAAGDLVESVDLQDSFTHPKTQRASRTYRLVYRSMNRSLTNEEVNDIQERVRQQVVDQLKVELR